MKSSEAAKWLLERDRFLLLTHTRPDGDTLCSAAALTLGLRRAGKTAYLLDNAGTTEKYRQFVGAYTAPAEFIPDCVVTVDVASEGLFPENAQCWLGKVDLAIDHHPSNSGFAGVTCLEADSASCGEVICRVLREIHGDLTAEEAALLYVAVSTDTGCFMYANTTAETLETAANLVQAGAPNGELNKLLFRTKSRGRIAFEAQVLSGIEFYRQGSVAIAVVTRSMLEETGVDENDLDDIAAIPGQIEGVVVGITIRELKNGDSKVSVRTMRWVSANQICALFGGGGHAMAAGCTISSPVEQAKSCILKAVEQVWTESE